MWFLLTAIAAAVPRSPCEAHPVPPAFDASASAGANLRCADLRGLDLVGANFSGADLTGAWFHAVDLTGANFAGAELEFAHLEGASLRDANLSGASLRRSVLRNADLYGANLDDADLCWVDITEALYITAAHTEGTVYCRSTVLPDELYQPERVGWRFKPFFREPREHLVSVISLQGLSIVEYSGSLYGPNTTDGLGRIFDGIGTTVGLEVLALDFVPPFLDASHRHWLSSAGFDLSLGLGASQIENTNFTAVTANIGVFGRPVSFLQLETGLGIGVTLSDAFEQKFDASPYFGIRVSVNPLVQLLDDVAETLLKP